jgi:hypothetical protein
LGELAVVVGDATG